MVDICRYGRYIDHGPLLTRNPTIHFPATSESAAAPHTLVDHRLVNHHQPRSRMGISQVKALVGTTPVKFMESLHGKILGSRMMSHMSHTYSKLQTDAGVRKFTQLHQKH